MHTNTLKFLIKCTIFVFPIQAELRLTITAPLQVDVVPNVMSVHMGASAEFRCTVTSNGITIGLQHITWYKDGRQLPSSSRSGDTLLISDVGREDKGMYQCVVRRQDGDSFQASAELQLGGKLNLSSCHWGEECEVVEGEMQTKMCIDFSQICHQFFFIW